MRISAKQIKPIKRKQQKLLNGVFVFLCILSLHFASCQPEPSRQTMEVASQKTDKEKVQPVTGYPDGLSQYLVTRNVDTAKETTDANTIKKDESVKKTEFVQDEPQAPKAWKRTIALSAKGQGRTEDGGQKTEDGGQKTEVLSSAFSLPILDKAGMDDELITVNFDQVDIRMMLKTIGDVTGINFVIDEGVHGNITVMSPTKIRLSQIYRFLESVLEVSGYAAVPSGDLVKIVPRAEAVQGNLQVHIGSDPSEIAQSDSIITQIIPLSYADADEVSRIIQLLLPAGSHIAVYPRTNSIMIIDTSSNIHHIARIIQQLDVAGAEKQVTTIGLKYASAKVLSEQITKIMDKNKSVLPPAERSRTSLEVGTDVKIIPDVRTNSLTVVANAQDTQTIEALVESLDIQRPNRAGNIHVVYLRNAQAEETAKSLAAAVSNLKLTGAFESSQDFQISADVGTNSLIIAASSQDFEVMADIIEKLDIVREQVLVEMLIVEVSEETLKEIGIDWATLDRAVEGSVRFFGTTNFGTRVDYLSGDLEGLSVGAWKKNGSETTIGPILHALDKKSGVNILSTPHITTSNHQKAKIVVGENRPFVTASRITETTDPSTPTVIKTFEYKDVGITLQITPHISQGGLVRLEISSEFTKLVETVTNTPTDTPTTAKRQAETVVTMNSGSTVVIGGLIRDDKVTVDKKVPLVSDIPLVGDLFKFRSDQMQKTNLLIFITPHVMGSQQDIERITEQKKEEMNSKIQDSRPKTQD
jgi:general secretion pathway protein D